MYRVLRAGGVTGIGLSGEKNGPILIWEAARKRWDPTFEPKPINPTEWLRSEQAEAAMFEVGFNGVNSEMFPMRFEVEDAGDFLHFWFEWKNPVAAKCINQWEGDLDPVEQAVRQVLKDSHGDGRNIIIEAILATRIT